MCRWLWFGFIICVRRAPLELMDEGWGGVGETKPGLGCEHAIERTMNGPRGHAAECHTIACRWSKASECQPVCIIIRTHETTKSIRNTERHLYMVAKIPKQEQTVTRTQRTCTRKHVHADSVHYGAELPGRHELCGRRAHCKRCAHVPQRYCKLATAKCYIFSHVRRRSFSRDRRDVFVRQHACKPRDGALANRRQTPAINNSRDAARRVLQQLLRNGVSQYNQHGRRTSNFKSNIKRHTPRTFT